MKKTIKELRKYLEQKKGQKAQIEKDIKHHKDNQSENQLQLERHEQAREIIREVGLGTQEGLQYHISDITTLALDAVFNDPYNLNVSFVERRNKTECDLMFERGGELMKPQDASGGGAVDIASFALRVASWAMASPRSRPVLILDEPFKMLSADLMPRAGEMLKQISEKLGLQIIMVTHSEDLIDNADLIFRVTMKKGVSKVEVEN